MVIGMVIEAILLIFAAIVFTISLFFCWLVMALFALYLLKSKKEPEQMKKKLDLVYGIMDGKK